MDTATFPLPRIDLDFLRRGSSFVLWLVVVVGTALIVISSWAYVLPHGTHPFLDERPELASWPLWRASLAVHVGGGLLTLPLGLLLLVPGLVGWSGRAHRWLGRGYAATYLLTVFPTGVFLSFFAKGAWATGPGFFLSALFATLCLALSLRCVMRGDVLAHRHWMLRSYAQLASAVSFRVLHLAFQLEGVAYETNYVLSLWGSVVGNALLAELLIAAHHRTLSRRVVATASGPSPHPSR